jgi:hypothetical protein
VQRSDDPSPERVRDIVTAGLGAGCDRAYCVACAARVAQEAGDHPEEYAARMRWALSLIAAAFPDAASSGLVAA